MSGDPEWFGCVVPRRVRWWCPTYYAGAVLGFIPVVAIVTAVAATSLVLALFLGMRDGFVAPWGK